MNSDLQSYMLETLGWTAVLIAAVLLLRRPVARWFGPQFAYALWAIPVLRLLLPPIELPAWMKPAVEPASTTTTEFLNLNPDTPVATQNGSGGFEAAAPSSATTAITPVQSLDIGPFIEICMALWLIGAAIFLYMRFAAYFELRDELLGGSSEVGRQGAVRLVETPGTDAPIAFGVIDKVIALPSGFLAQSDLTARDLALAHELEHHQGHDLLINVLVQPLFALHWWNPLGRYGWLALRRDQEAACDARVIAAAPEDTKEAYANLIVRFAAGPNATPTHALAAPMACPVLGEKSIIHRLRSLNMSDTSKSRRMAGRFAMGAAVLALPLTATISYAANEVTAPPAPPEPASILGVTPPAPPAPPAPPTPPAPPAPPAPFGQETVIEIDSDGDVSASGGAEYYFVTTSDESQDEGATRREERRIERTIIRNRGDMSEQEIEEIMVEVREGLAEADRALENVPMIIEEALASTEGLEGRTIVRMSCNNDSDEVASTTENADGTRIVMVCQTRVMAHALEGLKEAREEISRSREMSSNMRERIVRELDQQITRWENEIT